MAIIISTVALVVVILHRDETSYRMQQAERLNDAKILAGAANAVATSNACRVDSRMALEKVSELRETMAARGIQYQHE